MEGDPIEAKVSYGTPQVKVRYEKTKVENTKTIKDLRKKLKKLSKSETGKQSYKQFLKKKQILKKLKDTGLGIIPKKAIPIHYEPIVKNLGGRPRKTTNKISSDILNQPYIFGGK